MREGRKLDGQHYHEAAETNLLAHLQSTQIEVHEALCDSFDTARALESMVSLVNAANTYVSAKQGNLLNTTPLEAVASWITRILRTFGLGEGPGFSYGGRPEIGWGDAIATGAESADVSCSPSSMPAVQWLNICCRKRLSLCPLWRHWLASEIRSGNWAKGTLSLWLSATSYGTMIWFSSV